MIYEKLVRDKIPEILEAKNVPYRIRIADEKEYWDKLKEKLCEEVQELINTNNDTDLLLELCDVLEVIDYIIKYKAIRKNAIDTVKKTKREERGGFNKRIILEES